MARLGYKKYMKQERRDGNPLLKIFIVSFFGMLLFSTFVIKSFSPKVDTSIGGDQEQLYDELEDKNSVDGRLQLIQKEDQGNLFNDISAESQMAEDIKQPSVQKEAAVKEKPEEAISYTPAQETPKQNVNSDIVYKVYIGAYTSAEQAKVEKDIILESGSGLNPIVKCIGSNNYTLQVGIFKNKKSAESLLNVILQSHLPGRIVQEN